MTHGLQPVYPLGSFTTYYKAEDVEALLTARAQEIEQVKAAIRDVERDMRSIAARAPKEWDAASAYRQCADALAAAALVSSAPHQEQLYHEIQCPTLTKSGPCNCTTQIIVAGPRAGDVRLCRAVDQAAPLPASAALQDLIAEMRSIALVAGQCSVEGPEDTLSLMAAAEAERASRWADQLAAALSRADQP